MYSVAPKRKHSAWQNMARKASSGPDGDAARGQGAEPGNLDVGPPPRRLQAAASTLDERQARCRGADPKSPPALPLDLLEDDLGDGR